MADIDLEGVYSACRPELVSYGTRLTARPEIADELAQEAALRLIAAPPAFRRDASEVRAWLFRVVSNLAVDYLRRHSTWREMMLLDARSLAEGDEAFVAESRALRGSPEARAIAQQHLAVCFSCTARNLDPQQSAALLLKEVYDFSTSEAAAMLDATPVQVKNWIQQARGTLQDRYAHTCALVNKQGVCHQCIELDGFFNGTATDPLGGTTRDVDARLALLRDQRATVLTSWHRRLLKMLDDVLTT